MPPLAKPSPASARIDALRAALGRLTAHAADAAAPPLATGLAAIDAALPGGGLARAALHEVAGAGPETEHAAAATLFAAGLLARHDIQGDKAGGRVLWVLQQRDLFAPAVAGVGLHPDRVIYAEASRPEAVLLAIEDALRHRGLAGVVGEFCGKLTLTASRRLQLASEAIGTPCFLLRRSRRHDDPLLAAPNAAVTRWRVACMPSAPALDWAPGVPGLARARWRLELIRCRGAAPGSWVVEGCDAQGRLGVPGEFLDRPAAARVAG